MMKSLPFPNGHDINIERDIVTQTTGAILPKEQKIRIKGFTEIDILEIREILQKEIKRQNEITQPLS